MVNNVNYKFRVEASGRVAVVDPFMICTVIVSLLNGYDIDTRKSVPAVPPEDIRITVVEALPEPQINWQSL